MLRKLHGWPGLLFALILTVTAISGAILAFDACIAALSAPTSAGATIRLNDLAEQITARFPDVEKIARTPLGTLRMTYAEDGIPRSVLVDPETVTLLGPEATSATMRTILNLHRAWLGGDGGRLVAGFSALAMLLLTVTGLIMLKRQVGGWRRLLRPLAGSGARRWHQELGRLALAGLLLSAATGVYLSLTGFEILPDGAAQNDAIISGSGGTAASWKNMSGLADLRLADLREITLPYSGDATDPITVKTGSGIRHIDAATGLVLREEVHPLAWHIQDLVYRLHTAQGMGWLALLLGLSATAGAVLGVTGVVIWFLKRRKSGSFAGNIRSNMADILLLFGSEGRTTQGFAETLHRALTTAGHSVHIAAMNDLPQDAAKARLLIVITATAGNGEAPVSATQFLAKLNAWHVPARMEAIVLGFGDRAFDRFCGYAETVEAALRARGIPLAMPTTRIDQQSVAHFQAWGGALAVHLGTPLTLNHQPAQPPLHRFRLIERADYGEDVQAPTAILRFQVLSRHGWIPQAIGQKLGTSPRFAAGDLIGIRPPGESRPRYYSVASSARSGVLEICVRRQPGGLCSELLHNLLPGDVISGAIRENPAFRPNRSDRPLILIGAGAGIAPLVGFVRETGHHRPVHLYWGGRNPASDYLYREELEGHALEGRLAGLRTTFSRIRGGGYVQHLLEHDSTFLRAAIQAGAQIMVCGGLEMAEGVRRAIANAIAPLGIDLATLRQRGDMLEDVY